MLAQTKTSPPVKPLKVPNLPWLKILPQLIKDPYNFLTNAYKQYGNIYAMNLGIAKIIFINHPHYAEHVLRNNHRNYAKTGPMWESLRLLIGNGLPASEGDFWLRQRRLLQPQFHRKKLANLANIMVDAIDGSTNHWEEFALSGKPFNVAQAFNSLALSVISKTMFGANISTADSEEIDHNVQFINDYIFQMMIISSLVKWGKLPSQKRFDLALQKIETIIYRIIKEYREQEQEEPRDTLIGMLLDIVDEETGEGMTNSQLRDEAVTIFIAGYDTSAVTLSWIFYFLAQYPEVQQKVHAEIESILGDRKPVIEDLPKFRYIEMVFQEALRLYPVAFFIGRTVDKDDVIDNYHIPSGSMAVVLTSAIQRNLDFWENPDEFNPERFTVENSQDRDRFSMIPFGAGPRQCIGNQFAQIEIQLAMIRILQRYYIRPAFTVPPKVHVAITLRPEDGIDVYLQKRN